jgi:hypothetical protein
LFDAAKLMIVDQVLEQFALNGVPLPHDHLVLIIDAQLGMPG